MNPVLLFSIFTLLAFLLLAAEVFIPGGVIGAVGALCLLVACGFALAAFGPSTGILVAFLLIALTLGCFMIWLAYMPRSRIGKRFALQTSLQRPAETPGEFADLLNHTGVAETDLRPSGYARIDGRKVDVVTQRGFLEKGSAIRVVEVRGARVVVRAEEAST